MNFQSWYNGSSIDVAGGGGLLVNYFCGKDIYLGTGTGTGGGVAGTAGASIYTGDKFYARKNAQIGASWQAIDPNVSLNIMLEGTTSGLKLWSGGNPNVKLIHDNYDQFVVMGDGRTSIGTNTVPLGYKLAINGKVICEELNVQLKANWPDYVFEKSHKRLTISQLDEYITTNKHLPGFKKGDQYVKDGLNISELLIKQQEKIEELTLYIIELKKEVDVIKDK